MGEPQDGPRPLHLLSSHLNSEPGREPGREPSRVPNSVLGGALDPPAAGRRRRRDVALWLALLLSGVVLVLLATRLAALLGEGTDLFGRWYGLRRLLLSGADPYGAVVTRELAARTTFLAADPSSAAGRGDLEAAFGFLYPLPGVLFLVPLAVLPYPTALTSWLLVILLALPGAAWLLADSASPGGLRRAGAGRVGLLAVPLALLFLPTFSSLLHAQLAPAVAIAVALAYRLSRRRAPAGWASPASPLSDVLAGAALAAGAAVKPHLLALVAPLWLTYHLHRWWRGGPAAPGSGRFAGGALGGGLLLATAATLLLPSWPLGFWRAALAYGAIAGTGGAETLAVLPGGPALLRLAESLLPAGPAGVLAAAAGAALLAWAVAGWRDDSHGDAGVAGGAGGAGRNRRDSRDGDMAVATGLERTVIVSALVVPPAWESNAVLLIVPLALRLGRLGDRPRAAGAFVAASVLLTLADLPLYLTRPWHNGPLLIAGYAVLLAAAGIAGRRRQGVSRPAVSAPGADAPSLRG